MKILAISTTNINSYVALKNDDLISIKNVIDKQSEKLLPTIDETLTENKLALKDIDCFAVNVGPGSFTGIRIGLATIKAFLFSQNKPCIVLNSFDLVSYNILDKDFVVIVDSGNKDFYYAIYKNGQIVELSNLEEDAVIKLAKNLNLPLYVSSLDEDKIHNDYIKVVKFNKENILNIAINKFNNNEIAVNTDLSPIYVKKSQAENSLNENIAKNLTIEKCTNYKDILLVENECFVSPWTENMFVDEFNQNDRMYFQAKVKNEVVGYIGASDNGEEINILKLAVIPRFRSLSIGQKLVETIIKIKNEKGYKNLFLEVDDKNEKAIRLYKRCGFDVVSTRKRYYQNGDDCLVMFLK